MPRPARSLHAALAPQHRPPPELLRTSGACAAVSAARRMNRAAVLLSAAVLGDSAVEHYRGAFRNRAMIAPLVSATLSLAASAHGTADRRASAHRLRDSAYAGAALTGFIGTGFHLYNIFKRPGRWSWQNLFYAAPIGAPAALALAGVTGYLAERVRDRRGGLAPRIAGVQAGRVVAATAAVGLAGTVAEVSLLHLRGAYHSPYMYLPVTIPPVTATLMGAAALAPAPRLRRITRVFLRLTAVLGLAGAALHVRGVARNMGGWRNPRQNVLNGPPIPAPPSFTGLALTGLAALQLLADATPAAGRRR
jgi:hypothetical protein